jgi:fucose 4-O-acetylase-like acetyltransferase
MRQRLEYIDALKGFAILLVVMGHVIPWSFESLDAVTSMSPTPILLWKIIYSFHMPLFMFISGFLFGQSHFTSVKEYFVKMWKKMKMLIIPWLVCGILVQMWRGGRELTYWYLLTLFQLLLLVGIENFFFDKIKNKTHQIIVEVITLGTTLLILNFATHFYNGSALYVCYDWYPHLRGMFGYFALGSFIMRHIDMTTLMNSKMYSVCLLFFCISCVVDIPYTSFMSISLKSITAIYCCLYMFKVCFTEGYAINYFKRIGKKTLQIYILHLFFGIKIIQIGQYLITLVNGDKMEFITAFVLQLLFSLALSMVIIELCLIAGKIIKTSKLFSFMILGE